MRTLTPSVILMALPWRRITALTRSRSWLNSTTDTMARGWPGASPGSIRSKNTAPLADRVMPPISPATHTPVGKAPSSRMRSASASSATV